jgi:lysylphosphatidylglycerol synthetase-like protein (DUF2156 family)
VRRLRGEVLLGWAAAAVGLIGIAPALTPEFANRSDFVRGVLPPVVPEAAQVAALTFGLALVWLSRLLGRRRRRAWQLAVVLVIGISLAHLAKGLDFEEAAVGLLFLVALLLFRARFDGRGIRRRCDRSLRRRSRSSRWPDSWSCSSSGVSRATASRTSWPR